jgi:DNA-binding transcriptional LysR family regulator
MLDHLNRMAVFQAVAEAGSFRAGAKRLGLSPSVVSHHVSALEAQLEQALFYRTTRKLSLSDAGIELLAAARRMTEAADLGLQAMQARRAQPVGKLKVTVPAAAQHPSFGIDYLDFLRHYPGIEMSISFDDAIIDMPGSDFDVAIRGVTSGLPDSGYKSRVLQDFDMCLVVAADYAAARPVPKTASDLADWNWIEYPPGLTLQTILSRDQDRRAARARTALRLNSIFIALDAARAGLGVLPIPRCTVADDIAAGRLVPILAHIPLRAIKTHIIWPANAGPNSPTRLFIDFTLNNIDRGR